MGENIRVALSRWLAPKIHERAERYTYLRMQLSEAERWLGHEWPEIDAAIRWAKVSEVLHFRPLDAVEPYPEAVPGKPWIHSISDFREHLRKERQAKSSGEQPIGSERSDEGHAPRDTLNTDLPHESKSPDHG